MNPSLLSGRKLRLGVLVVTAAGTLLIAACSSSPHSAPRPIPTDPVAYMDSLEVPIVQCFIDRHVLPGADYKKESWYHAGKVIRNEKFALWWSFNNGLEVNGKELADWVHDAAFNGQWPTSLCGTQPAPSAS